MKILIGTLLSLLLVLGILLVFPLSGEEDIYSSVLRLHILAESDDTADQTAKLAVRDALLSEYGAAFSLTENKEAAVAYVRENLAAIEKTAATVLAEHGYEGSVTATLAEEWFDTRVYEEITLPGGTYTALKITIGAGKGQNLWCMLYPALCVTPALGEVKTESKDAFDEDTYLFLTRGGYGVRFRVLELLSAAFR